MILDLLKKRESVRRFSSERVSKDTIKRILEAGRLAPSGGNEQSWKFGVITDRNLIDKITELAYGQKWMGSASFLIVLCTGIVEKERGGRDILISRFPELKAQVLDMPEQLYAALAMEENQTKIPGTQMMLAALEEGIGSTWVSYFQVQPLNRLLNLPQGWTSSEILVFGYPDQQKGMKPKKPIEDLIFWNVCGGEDEG